MEGHAVISHDVLASYAADATLEVDGVDRMAEAARRHRGVRVTEDDGALTVEVHVTLAWGTPAADVGARVQSRVAEYLVRTAKLPSIAVDVVVGGIAPAR